MTPNTTEADPIAVAILAISGIPLPSATLPPPISNITYYYYNK